MSVTSEPVPRVFGSLAVAEEGLTSVTPLAPHPNDPIGTPGRKGVMPKATEGGHDEQH